MQASLRINTDLVTAFFHDLALLNRVLKRANKDMRINSPQATQIVVWWNLVFTVGGWDAKPPTLREGTQAMEELWFLIRLKKRKSGPKKDMVRFHA